MGKVGFINMHYILEKHYIKAVFKRAWGKRGNLPEKIARKGGVNQRFFFQDSIGKRW